MSLYEINGAIAQLAEMLTDGDIDQQTYEDTVSSLGAVSEIEELVKAIRNKEAEVEMFKAEKDRLAERQKSAEAACERMKAILTDYMKVSNSKSVNTGLFKITLGQTQSVDLLYEDTEFYPEEYLIEQKPKLDKRKMLAALKAGDTIDGAALHTTEYVKIK